LTGFLVEKMDGSQPASSFRKEGTPSSASSRFAPKKGSSSKSL
jgi:hypothetical protein